MVVGEGGGGRGRPSPASPSRRLGEWLTRRAAQRKAQATAPISPDRPNAHRRGQPPCQVCARDPWWAAMRGGVGPVRGMQKRPAHTRGRSTCPTPTPPHPCSSSQQQRADHRKLVCGFARQFSFRRGGGHAKKHARHRHKLTGCPCAHRSTRPSCPRPSPQSRRCGWTRRVWRSPCRRA